MDVVGVILWVAGAYAGAGVLVALAFVAWGVPRVDPAARGAGVGFRAIVFPGAALLWPLTLKWMLAPPARGARGARTPARGARP